MWLLVCVRSTYTVLVFVYSVNHDPARGYLTETNDPMSTILVLVHMAIYDGTPEYLVALLLQHTPPRSLRSVGGLRLEMPKMNFERFGRRAFVCAGPTLWNKFTKTYARHPHSHSNTLSSH